EVAEFVMERMAVRKGNELRTEVVLLGVAALLGEPLPKDRNPVATAHALRAEFPTDEVASKLADALAKQGGLLDALRAKLEALLSSLASSLTSKLDALAASVCGRLDALASSVASLLVTLTGVRRTLDAVNGKLDGVVTTLAGVAATVNDVDAQGEASRYQRAKDTRAILRAVRRMGGLVALVGGVGFVTVLVLLVGVLSAVRQAQSDASRAETTSVVRHPPAVNVVNGATSEASALVRAALALLNMGKKEPKELWIPKEPAPWQKKKDCEASLGETAINGGCWVKVADMAPPCGQIFRHGNACYRPVAADPLKPVGMAPGAPVQP
ncbi:MAG TPA: hypothetical protein VK447_16495, partial [Myxococcaceae bacterium]|nr:hypothetical protein [Myxococcaceae bacterium]